MSDFILARVSETLSKEQSLESPGSPIAGNAGDGDGYGIHLPDQN